MKKIFLALLISFSIISNANAGIWTYAQATSAANAAKNTEEVVIETQKEVKELKKEIQELKEQIKELIKTINEMKGDK